MNGNETMRDRVAVLTGAGGGIGSAICERLLAAGATVIAADLSQEALGRLDAGGAPGRLHTIRTDVTDEEACAGLARFTQERAGGADILINNAGHFPPCPFEEMSFAQWRRVIGINLDSVFLVTQAVLPLIRPRGWGRVINIGSNSVFQGTPNHTHYVAAKAGVLGFSRSLARELGKYGITVNVVAPGLTSTAPVLAANSAEFLENRRLQRAIARHQQPQDVVGAVLFLASPQSDFITGQMLNVDGGAVMH